MLFTHTVMETQWCLEDTLPTPTQTDKPCNISETSLSISFKKGLNGNQKVHLISVAFNLRLS